MVAMTQVQLRQRALATLEGKEVGEDTLLGLIEKTPGNYIDANDESDAWKPSDAVSPNGVKITDMPSMMAAAGVL